MRNLFLKVVVLLGVMGGSCFVAWKAHHGLQEVLPTDANQFTRLESDEKANPFADDPAPAALSFGEKLAAPNALEPGLDSAPAPEQGEEPEETTSESPSLADLGFGEASPPSARPTPRAFPGADDDTTPAPAGFSLAPPKKNTAAASEDPFEPLPDQDVQPAGNSGLALPTPEPLASNENSSQDTQAPKTLTPAPGMLLFTPSRPPTEIPAPESEPDQGSDETPSKGLTKLSPSNPGPVLLAPPQEEKELSLDESVDPGVVTAEGRNADSPNVQPAAGESSGPRPFLSLDPEPAAPITAPDAASRSTIPRALPSGDGPEPAPLSLPSTTIPPRTAAGTVPQPARAMPVSDDPFAGPPSDASSPEVKTEEAPAPANLPLPPVAPQQEIELEPTPARGPVPSTIPSTLPSEPGNGIGSTIPRSNPAPASLPEPEVLPEPAPLEELEPTPARTTPPPEADPFGGPSTGSAPSPQSTIPNNSAPEPAQRFDRFDDRVSREESDRSAPQSSPSPGAATPEQLIGQAEFDPQAPAGPQTPELKIEKIAPPEAVIGEPLVYAIVIRNVGGSEARDVVVEDRIPRGTQLEGTIPQAYLSDGKLKWNLGTLTPGDERKVQLKVIPLEPGQIGSVATVSFAASVAASIRITAPELSVSVQNPPEAIVGQKMMFHFTLRNTGKGNARNVFLRTVLPEGLKHPGGNDLEYEVGALPPGSEKTIDLAVTPDVPGTFTPRVIISNDGKSQAETRTAVRVIKSRLQITRTGPAARFVGRPGVYVTKVSNDSGETLRNITIQEVVPPGVELASMPPGGRWDPVRRLILWTIPQLAPQESRDLTSQLVPSSAGEHQGSLIAQDIAGNRVELKTMLDVKGFADLDLDVNVSSAGRTVLVGEQVSLRLKVKNDGTAPARDVRTRFEIPPGLSFTAAKGPVDYETQGNVVEFASLEEVPVSAERSFDIVLTAAQEGATKVTVSLESADYGQPLISEKPIRIISNGR